MSEASERVLLLITATILFRYVFRSMETNSGQEVSCFVFIPKRTCRRVIWPFGPKINDAIQVHNTMNNCDGVSSSELLLDDPTSAGSSEPFGV